MNDRGKKMKISAAQAKALQTIADNPGKVVSNVNNKVAGYLKIHATAAASLKRAGLIEDTGTGIERTYTFRTGYKETYELRVWQLTESGREAIR